MLSLVHPSVDRYDAWIAAHREWGPGLHEDGFGIGEDDRVDSEVGFAAWISKLRQGPGDLWWIVEDGVVLGGIALRAPDDPRAARHGHVGYGVRPSARGRGVASWALAQVVDLARDAGRQSIALVCLSDNVASIRTIERCGGTLEKVLDDGRAQRFVIRL
ncbi:acetyltransferase [Flexivirga endophytica]|uniref:Acetyltransferase n=1 Tax=Flexivirga endophytica TaxID=1849103 RepID=A0A916WYR9_9MICO|nr:acetyltransferase [Flexivirga endophytica]GHB48891.1 acetyltransferase [Flexivirga endophytica]